MKSSRWQSIRFKITVLFLIFGLALITMVYIITFSMITRMEETLIASRLHADIKYIEDLIGDGEWNVKGGAIYLGDTLVGDGTHEKANLAPFLEHEEKTGTFSYVFIKCGDEGLGHVEDTPTTKGYWEGHYLRVAGSTRDPNGDSIVGTYMDVQVADILDAEDTYGGEANVAGGMIYCRYNTLKDADGNVVGAIVVGRNISELRAQVREVMRIMIASIIALVVAAIAVLLFFINRWTGSIGEMTAYLKEIEEGKIPDTALETKSKDELATLVTGINRMTDSLRENEMLRVKSETDQLTGLMNRFGLNRCAEEAFERCYREQKPIAIGIMDIDFFKPYNDHYGHIAGDKCIIRIAEILKEMEKQSGVKCARFGGDEFILVCEGRSEKEVEMLAGELRERVQAADMPHEFSDVAEKVTLSQGYSVGVPTPHQKLSNYVHVADGALYEAKESGKNSFRIEQISKEYRPSDDLHEGQVSQEFDSL